MDNKATSPWFVVVLVLLACGLPLLGLLLAKQTPSTPTPAVAEVEVQSPSASTLAATPEASVQEDVQGIDSFRRFVNALGILFTTLAGVSIFFPFFSQVRDAISIPVQIERAFSILSAMVNAFVLLFVYLITKSFDLYQTTCVSPFFSRPWGLVSGSICIGAL